MAQQAPLHKDPTKLSPVPEPVYKEINKHLKTGSYVLDPYYADHIAANIYQKRRNFSFSVAVKLLRSFVFTLFTHADYPEGYTAVGTMDADLSNPEDKFTRSGRIAVVFKLRYNKRTQHKEVMIITGWSEFDAI